MRRSHCSGTPPRALLGSLLVPHRQVKIHTALPVVLTYSPNRGPRLATQNTMIYGISLSVWQEQQLAVRVYTNMLPLRVPRRQPRTLQFGPIPSPLRSGLSRVVNDVKHIFFHGFLRVVIRPAHRFRKVSKAQWVESGRVRRFY